MRFRRLDTEPVKPAVALALAAALAVGPLGPVRPAAAAEPGAPGPATLPVAAPATATPEGSSPTTAPAVPLTAPALPATTAAIPVTASAATMDPGSPAAVEERLKQLKTIIATEGVAAKRWWYSWLGIFTAAMAGQYAIALAVDDPSFQHRGLVGGSAAAIGVGSVLFSPLPAGRARRSRALSHVEALDHMPPDQQLAQVEAWMAKTDRSLKFGRSWLAAAGGFLVGSAQFFTLWLVWDQPQDGAVAFGMAQAAGLTKLFTTPRQIRREWAAYQQRWDLDEAALAPKPKPTLHVGPYTGGAGGLELAVRF